MKREIHPQKQRPALPELLAPAGDFERLQMALLYGADAVYLGGQQLSMRAAAPGFSPEELAAAVTLCHSKGTKVYLTANTIPHPEELFGMRELFLMAQAAGVDAVIVADIGALMLLRETVPQMPVHISTQAGVVNHLSANAFYKLGASRVILARECTLEEIEQIRANIPPELSIEVFVHGSMCMSFSGRCLISDYLTGRSANSGACTQPCRWKWHLYEESRPGEFFPVYEDQSGSYILNARDLCLIHRLQALQVAGVDSFKIEGRQKSLFYTATVTAAYRAAIDSLSGADTTWKPPAWAVKELETVSHRPYSEGFLNGRIQGGQESVLGGYVREYDMCGVVEGWDGAYLHISQRGKFSVGETLEILPPGGEPISFVAEELLDGAGTPIQSAPHAKMQVQIKTTVTPPVGSILRKRGTAL